MKVFENFKYLNLIIKYLKIHEFKIFRDHFIKLFRGAKVLRTSPDLLRHTCGAFGPTMIGGVCKTGPL